MEGLHLHIDSALVLAPSRHIECKSPFLIILVL